MENNSGTNENPGDTEPGPRLDRCFIGYHNSEHLTDDSINYMNQFHKLINKTKDTDFDPEYQFTLRLLGGKKKESAKNSPDAGS